MIFVWDEHKRLTNLASRGLDFASLDDDFFASAVFVPAKHGRLMAVGELGGVTLAVIFRPLGTEAISIISMRRANRTERSLL